MKPHPLASIYAKAFFKLEQERLENFESFYTLLQQNPRLSKLLNSPQLLFDEKKAILKECLGEQSPQKFFHLILTLMEKRDLDLFPLILTEYRALVNERANILEATIVTAISIDPILEQAVKEKLEKRFQKHVKLFQEINPKMIGGAILLMGNSMIDWSIRERLTKLKEKLLVEGDT